MAEMNIKKALGGCDDLIIRKLQEDGQVVLTRDGKTVAVVISAEAFEKLRVIEREELQDIREAEKEIAEWKRSGESIPWEKIKQENNL